MSPASCYLQSLDAQFGTPYQRSAGFDTDTVRLVGSASLHRESPRLVVLTMGLLGLPAPVWGAVLGIMGNPSTAPSSGAGVNAEDGGAFLPAKAGSGAPHAPWTSQSSAASLGKVMGRGSGISLERW